MKSLTLLELNSLVRMTLEQAMPNEYWVEAELSEAREWGGHCYLELVQKDERGNTPVAKASAKCWRNTWMMLKPYFERTTGQALHAGMKVLLKVYAQFHESYGFSWIVTDIDPTYTMGDMARKRQEIIRQLKEEGVFDLNKELSLPMFAQRVAVISSANAAGYGDFCHQLTDNEYGFCFHTELFAAIMQGEQVERTVIEALNRINERANDFDCVVIIRGGGATSDLSGFDTLALAENVANFPLPVITGIGHDRDESVLDMVSNTRVKTPTAAAALLIDHLAQVLHKLEDAQETIVNIVKRRMTIERMRLERLASQIPMLFSVMRTQQEARLDRLFAQLAARMQQHIATRQARLAPMATLLRTRAEQRLMREQHRLSLLEKRAEMLNPELLLQRGYSITLLNGHAVSDATQLHPGDEITTRLAKGSVRSVVK